MIAKVTVTFKKNKPYGYRVDYESGRVRYHKENSKPKTVDKFVREHDPKLLDYGENIEMVYE